MYEDRPLSRTKDEVEAEARAKGKCVRYPEPDELFIDLDGEEAREEFMRRYKRVQESLGVDTYTLAPSATPGHYHVTVRLHEAIPEEGRDLRRLLMQAILGSDPMREALGYRRVLGKSDAVSVFFEALAEVQTCTATRKEDA